MGNPEADSSNFRKDQADYNVQIQQQQQFQPPPQQQQFRSAQNTPSPPSQFNRPYSTAPPPQSVAQFPPQIPQMNPAYAYARNGAYPPQQQPSFPPMLAAPQEYPPQQQPQYPHQSAPQAYPPNLPLPKPYPPPPAYQQQPAAQPVPFTRPAGEVQYAATEEWRTGLFDCMDDPMNVVTTLFFPWLTFGQVAEIIDNGSTTCETGGLMYALISIFTWMPWIYSCTYRSELRSKFRLEESPAPDWIVHFLCEPCALCQKYRELNLRGWDPSIGWLGNLQKQQQMQQQPQVAMMPPMNQTMMA